VVQTPQEGLHVEVVRFGRLLVGLVVEGEVVKNVRVARVALAIHPAQPIAHDVSYLITPCRIVCHHSRARRGEQERVPVVVLQPLTDEGGAAGGGAKQEPASHLVTGGPETIAGALETEH
jgi:hypothetical protein